MSIFPPMIWYGIPVKLKLAEGDTPCPHCDGTGCEWAGHSFQRGNMYTQCILCNGTGSNAEAIKLRVLRKAL